MIFEVTRQACRHTDRHAYRDADQAGSREAVSSNKLRIGPDPSTIYHLISPHMEEEIQEM